MHVLHNFRAAVCHMLHSYTSVSATIVALSYSLHVIWPSCVKFGGSIRDSG